MRKEKIDNNIMIRLRSSWRLIGIFLVFCTIIFIFGYLYNKKEEESFLLDKKNDLITIRDFKIDQIIRWKNERMEDAEIIKNDSFNLFELKKMLMDKNSKFSRDRIKLWIELLKKIDEYENISILDTNFRVVGVVTEEDNKLYIGGELLAKKARDNKEVIFSDFHKDDFFGTHLNIFIPLFIKERNKSIYFGTIMLHIDPNKFIYPLIQAWPTPSPSSEIILVEQMNDEVVYLNELRHKKNTALKLRYSIHEKNLIAAKVVMAQELVLEGNDYRGIPVLAVSKKIPSTNWFIIAKTDLDEIYSSFNERRTLGIIALFLMLIIGGLALSYYSIQQQKKIDLKNYKDEETIKRFKVRFQTIWDNSFDGMRLTDSEGKIILVNDAFCNMMEKSKEELEGKFISVSYKQPDQLKTLEKYKKRFLTKTFLQTMEREMVIWNNKIKWFDITNSFIESENDNPLLFSIFRDITERKLFERSFLENQEKLLHNEEKYHQLVDTAMEGIIQIDISGKIIYTNSRMMEMLRYENEELIGKSIFNLIDQKNAKILEEKLENRRKGIKEQYELEMIRKDDVRIFVYISASPIKGKDGNQIGSFGIFMDITEKKIIQELLIFERHLFTTIMDSSPDFIYFKDLEGKFIRVNRALAELFGLKNPSEAIGKDDFDFLSNESAERFNRENKNLIRSGERIINIDSITKLKNNQIFWTSVTKMPFRNSSGEMAGVLGINRDITERKLMEQILWNEKEELRITLSSVGDGVITTNSEGIILLMNKKAEEISGWMHEDSINKQISEIILLLNNRKEEGYINPIKKLLKQEGADNFTDEAILITKSNEDRIINYTVSAILGKDSKRSGFIIVFRDITEQRTIESQFILSQKMESIGQLAAGISHEINTPIQYVGDNIRFLNESFSDISKIFDCIMTLIEVKENKELFNGAFDKLIELLDQNDIEFLRSEIPNALSQSITGIDRVRNIVLAMKDFAHPGIKAKAFSNLNHGIEVTVTISKNEWKYVADLETDLDKDLPSVFCNLDEINQVLLNIIVNAAHSIKDVIEKQPGKMGKIIIKTNSDADFAIIKISDTGKGIPKEIINRIFDPFFTTKEVGKGTGQGLAIAHNIIVNKHKGSINVDSEIGKGTIFTLKLPIKEIKNDPK